MYTQDMLKEMLTGWWRPKDTLPQVGDFAIKQSIFRAAKPVFLIDYDHQLGVAQTGSAVIGDSPPSDADVYPLYGYAPPLSPENMGDPLFKHRYGLRYPLIAGEMARGITSVDMVEKVGLAGMMGFFGAAGLTLEAIETAIDRLQRHSPPFPFGFNLIHNPYDPEMELAVAGLYVKRGLRIVSASAYMDLTLPLVYYRVKGIHRDAKGDVVCPNKVIAKVSRVEVARKFLSPPPQKLLSQLVDRHLITAEEAALAVHVPMAEDLTAEADSGGHTDNRPAISLLPTMLSLRDEMVHHYRYNHFPCVGLGGGIATPESTAAAFAMGAAYVVVGSVFQSCMEAGTSETVRQMLAQAGQADITMSPCADMFELGVKVQVLKRGTMFPQRAAKLYELYCRYDRLEALPEKEKALLERDFFRCRIEDEWNQTRQFFSQRDPQQIQRAETDPKHKMALVFRSYLGKTSKWAIQGDPSRKIDYQIWCGPALGAFNEWVKGSFLQQPENRKTVTVAMNLLLGASVVTRANWLKYQGVVLPPDAGRFYPMELDNLLKLLE